MIDPARFIEFLENKGYRFFTGVPCSYFQSVIRFVGNSKTLQYYAAPNEGSALAMASGAYLAGQRAAVMIQNSGLGNMINPLTSLSMIYDLPVPLFVSGRAYGIPDEPQHEIMGEKMKSLLDSLNIRCWDLPQDESFVSVLEEGMNEMEVYRKPVVFFVRKGTFVNDGQSPVAKNIFPMKRIEAISSIANLLDEEDLIFATTGKISRELFASHDRSGNFYMQGSMGHIASLAFGAAVAKPERRVVVLDGDGAFLMHMGSASMVGHYRPENFYHFILDNESYETTGDQDTTSPTTDFEQIALACGYREIFHAEDEKSLQLAMAIMLATRGPVLLRAKINRLETKGIPRITAKYSAPQITESFMKHCQSGRVSSR